MTMRSEGGQHPRCLAIIPARGGGKRIPRKNVQSFEGFPMLVHAIRLARMTSLFESVVVSTDCPEIAAIAKRHGADVPFLRSEGTSDDCAHNFDVVNEVLDRLETLGSTWDIGVCIYPTAVLARPEDMVRAVEKISSGSAYSVMPVTRFEYPIWRALVVTPEGAPKFAFPEHAAARTQDLEPAFNDAGQWYAFDIAQLRAAGSLMTGCTGVVELLPQQVQDIYTADDLSLAAIKYRAWREAAESARPRPWVLIRADGNAATGSGHIMRCLSLAAAFVERGHDVVFASRFCSPELRQVISIHGHESVLLNVPEKVGVCEQLADAAAIVTWIDGQSRRPAWVVVDHYGLDATWEGAVRSCSVPLLALDDMADRPHACDVLLDQNMIEARHARYPKLMQNDTLLLLGGAYALVRPEFAASSARRDVLLSKGSAREVVLFAGSTDTDNLTLQLAMALLAHLDAQDLLVLVGHLNAHRQSIQEWCHVVGVRCEVGLENVASALEACRLLVGACGMTAVEAQALGIPCLLVALSPIQRDVAEWFASQARAVLLETDQCGDAEVVGRALRAALALPLNATRKRLISVSGATNAVDALMEFSGG